MLPVAILFGAAACVSCVAALAFGLAGLLGFGLSVPAFLGFGTLGWVLATALMAVLAVVAYRGHKQAQAAVERGEQPNPLWVFHGPRAAASLVLGFVSVALLALVSKLIIEGLTDLTYTIHWVRTVPLLGLGFAWLIHGEWNRHAIGRPA